MPKYQLIYTASEGDFEFDLFTGHYIIAETHEKAMRTAAFLDRSVVPGMKLKAVLKLLPTPYLHILYDHHEMHNVPSIICYRMLKPFSKNHIVYGPEDYIGLTESEFLKAVSKDRKVNINFEFVSLGVQEMKVLEGAV